MLCRFINKKAISNEKKIGKNSGTKVGYAMSKRHLEVNIFERK